MLIMWYWNSTHVCLLPRRRICRHVCLLHHTSNNVSYNCTWLTGMLGTHALDQCACLLYLYHTSNPTIIATGSVDIFSITHVWLCGIEPAHMSETKTPGQQLYMYQLHETIRPVAVPMSLNFALKQQASLWQLNPAIWQIEYKHAFL